MADDYIPEIGKITISPDFTLGALSQDGFIAVYTKSGSCAELTHNEGLCRDTVHGVNPEVAAELKSPLFLFNRLKAFKEGRGDGRLLMEKLIRILDEHQITVINPMNPYGSMKLGTLTLFFKKYGFRLVGEGVVVREPQPATKEPTK
jgi:hypothetical protein